MLSGEKPRSFVMNCLCWRHIVAIFAGLTALAAVSFIGQARERPWRRWAQVAMWGALAGLVALYWSTR